jgi:hypothetical protein
LNNNVEKSATAASQRLSRKSWIDANAFEKLSRVLASVDYMSETCILLHLILANLFYDNDEHENCGENNHDCNFGKDATVSRGLNRNTIQNLVLLVEVLAAQIESKTVLRIRIHSFRDSFDEETADRRKSSDADLMSEVSCVNDCGEFTLVDLLNCMYNLALNDNLKFELYETYQVKKYLR